MPAEDAPTIPPQELVEGEAHSVDSEAADSVGETAVEAVTQIPVTDSSEGTQWDIDKARTIGTATREKAYKRGAQGGEDIFDNTEIKELSQELASSDFEDNNRYLNNAKEGMQEAEAELAGLETQGHTSGKYRDAAERGMKSASERLEEAKELAQQWGEKDLETLKAEREEKIAAFERPLEELYDLAPETFASMPTSEFIDATREFTSLQKKLVKESGGLHTAEHISSELREQFLERKRGVYWDDRGQSFYYGNVASIVEHIRETLNIDDIDDTEESNRVWREVEDKYKAVFAGGFDKTPRQIVEGVLELTDGYAQQIAEKLQGALRQKQEFLKRHGVKTESERSEVNAAAATPESVN